MFLFFLKFIGFTLLAELLRPKPQVQNARPSGINEFEFPSTAIGRPIPVVFGTVRQEGPALLWYGDYSNVPIISYTKVKKLFKSKLIAQTTGYRYFIGLHMGLAQSGVESVHKIWSEERLAWSGNLSIPGSASIDAPDLYGGRDFGGGLVGTMSFFPGGTTQVTPPYLATQLASPPAFRGFTSAVFEKGEIGTTVQLRPLSFELRRIPAGLGLGAILTEDANPAEIAWEALTNPVWGAGADPSLLDMAGFTAVGSVLDSEGMGLSTLWDQRKEIDDFITDAVLQPIDGVIYPSMRDGIVKLKLIRDDYSIPSIPVLSPSNADLVNFSRTAWQGTTNDLRVVYTSRAGSYKQDVAPAFDLSNYDLQGAQRVSQQRQYPGVTRAALASELAWRDQRALSTPLAQATVRTNRSNHRLEQGDVFVLRWPERSIEQLVMRIKTVKHGAPGSRSIELECIQDVFSLAASAFAETPVTEWVEIVVPAAPVTNQDLEESPYLLLATDDGSASPGTVDPDDSYLLVVAERPNQVVLRADLETRISPAAFVVRGALEQFTPTGTLFQDYAKDTAAIDDSGTLIVENLTDAVLLEGVSDVLVREQLRNWAIINGEFIAWEDITDNLDGTYTFTGVWRGQFDTVPADHSLGDRIWFAAEGASTPEDTYSLGQTVDMRLVTATASGELDPGYATPVSHTITTRSLRPIPPGNVKINGEAFPTVIEGELVVTWAHRDRLTQTEMLEQDSGDVGPEAGVTYTLRIYDEDDLLLRTETGLAGTSYTYTDEVADAGRLQGHLRIELESVRGGLASHQFQEREFDRAGYGLQWGNYWGGKAP